MSFVNVKRTMAMALEATSGTAATVANSDFDIQFFDIQCDPEIEMWVNEFASGRHSQGPGVMGKKKATVSAKCALRVGAAAGTAPKVGKAFKACGQTETVVASTSVAYTPDATKDEGNNVTATIKVIFVPVSGSASIVTIKGAMGNCVISMDDLGQPLVAAFTFTGCFVSIVDGSALTLTSQDTSVPCGVIGSAITAAGTAQQIGKFSLDFGNAIELDYDPSDSTGYLAAYIGKRAPKWMMDPKKKLVASDAHYTRWAAGTESALSLATAVVSSLKYTVSAPKGQLSANKFGNRGEEVTYDQTYDLHESSGNDAHSVAISA